MADLELVNAGDRNWASKQNANLTALNNAKQEIATLDEDVTSIFDDPDSALRVQTNAAIDGSIVRARVFVPNAEKKIQTGGRLKQIIFGDSMGNIKMRNIHPMFAAVCGGYAGGGLVDGAGGSLPLAVSASATTGTVTQQTTAFDVWPSGLAQLFSTGASRTYSATTESTLTTDKITVYYAKEPGAGTFKIQIDGVDAPGFTSISAAGTLGELGVAEVTMTQGSHTVTVVNLTGTHRIVYVSYEDTTRDGFMGMIVAQGGISLHSITTTAWTNFAAFLDDQSPDLFTFEMKEALTYADGTTFETRIGEFIDTITDAAPTADVVLIASTPVSTGNDDQITQNSILRAAAQAAGVQFWDGYSPVGSYARMVSLGWEGDGTHPADACELFLGLRMFEDMGLVNVLADPVANRLSRMSLARSGVRLETAAFEVDQEFALDLYMKVRRWLILRSMEGTDVGRLDVSNADGFYTWLRSLRIGSSSGPRLVSVATNRLEVRDSGTGSSRAEIAARSYFGTLVILNNASGTVTLDLSAGNVFLVTMVGNITNLTYSNAPTIDGMEFEVHFIQDSTGGRTITGAHSYIRWADNTLPTLSATAGRRDIFRFRDINSVPMVEVSRSMNVNAG